MTTATIFSRRDTHLGGVGNTVSRWQSAAVCRLVRVASVGASRDYGCFSKSKRKKKYRLSFSLSLSLARKRPSSTTASEGRHKQQLFTTTTTTRSGQRVWVKDPLLVRQASLFQDWYISPFVIYIYSISFSLFLFRDHPPTTHTHTHRVLIENGTFFFLCLVFSSLPHGRTERTTTTMEAKFVSKEK